MMDRVFHARIGAAQYLALLLFTFMLVYCLWVKYILIAVLWGILLLRFIERIIHTTYTLTADGRLIVYGGRFRAAASAAWPRWCRWSAVRPCRWRAVRWYTMCSWSIRTAGTMLSSPSTRRSSCGCWRSGGRKSGDSYSDSCDRGEMWAYDSEYKAFV